MPKWLKITLLALGVGIVGLIVQFLPIIIMVISAVNAKIEVYDDISSYGNYLAGADRDGKNKWSKWDIKLFNQKIFIILQKEEVQMLNKEQKN